MQKIWDKIYTIYLGNNVIKWYLAIYIHTEGYKNKNVKKTMYGNLFYNELFFIKESKTALMFFSFDIFLPFNFIVTPAVAKALT